MPSRYLKIIDNIINKMKQSGLKVNEKLIMDAYMLAADAHKNDFRRSGAPYIEHPVLVADILSDIKIDDITIAASLLHDVAEDTTVSILEIEEKFGKIIADIVDGVTKINEIKFESLEHKQSENYRKLIISMIKDLRVIIIKFADRLHNIRTIKFMKPEKQVRIAKETLEIYAPLAYRLGMYKIKSELEDRAFEILQPEKYQEIKNILNLSKTEMEGYIEKIKKGIGKKLNDYGMSADVNGRVKHFYSIYKKHKVREKKFQEILDIIALRIILSNDDDCYKALKVIHNFFRPLPNNFTDYIAGPKPNGYRSLHTKVIFEGKVVEVQIRTKEMHEIAEYGLAAHWRYKAQNPHDKSNAIDQYIDKLKSILTNSFESSDPKEVLEELRINLVSGEIFVFTPKKDLIVLPAGSTPIDFAYKIHDNIGNHCIAAKISGKIKPLSTILQNGDVIDIMTSDKVEPGHEWLKFAKSSKARTAIKHFLKKNQYTKTLKLGEEIIVHELEKYNVKKSEQLINDLFDSMGFESAEELYHSVGQGKVKPLKFLRQIIPERKDSVLQKLVNRITFKQKSSGIKISKIQEKNVQMGKCCFPLPGENILGKVESNGQVVVHKAECENLEEISQDNLIKVFWAPEEDEHFNVKVRVIAEDRKDLLLDITKVINWANVNLAGLTLQVEDAIAKVEFIAQVKNLSHYTKIRKKLVQVRGLLNIERA